MRVVSKCANPACSERFLYLHPGKIFQLTPIPEIEAVAGRLFGIPVRALLAVRQVLQGNDVGVGRERAKTCASACTAGRAHVEGSGKRAEEWHSNKTGRIGRIAAEMNLPCLPHVERDWQAEDNTA